MPNYTPSSNARAPLLLYLCQPWIGPCFKIFILIRKHKCVSSPGLESPFFFSEKRSQPNKEKTERCFMASDFPPTELLPQRNRLWSYDKVEYVSRLWTETHTAPWGQGGLGGHWKAPFVLKPLTLFQGGKFLYHGSGMVCPPSGRSPL